MFDFVCFVPYFILGSTTKPTIHLAVENNFPAMCINKELKTTEQIKLPGFGSRNTSSTSSTSNTNSNTISSSYKYTLL